MDEIFEFEKSCDKAIDNLNLWQKPLRSVLTGYMMMADGLFFGGRFGRGITRDQYKAERILARLSYLAPHLDKCPRDLLKSGQKAMEAFDLSDGAEVQEAMMYAHFCEIMPEFRNKYYDVREGEGDYYFSHKSDEFSDCEVRDVLLTELSLGHDTDRPKKIPESAFQRISNQHPHKDVSAYANGAKVNYELHCSSFSEPTYLPDEAFNDCFGFSATSFRKVRAALWALADLLLGLSAFYEMSARYSVKEAHWQWRVVDCIAPTFRWDWLVSFVRVLTGVDRREIEQVISFLCSMEQNRISAFSGNGYLTPLFQLGDFVLTSPYLLRMMPSMRNMLYSLNKVDPEHFSKEVAQHLEAELLKEFFDVCEKVPNLNSKSNVDWVAEGRSGEIDAILFDDDVRFVLAIQAKAAIPPEGARMTRNVEARTIEAVDQIASFSRLSRENQRGILSKELGYTHEEFVVSHGILTRSGLGTRKAWRESAEISIFNVGILKYSHSNVPLSCETLLCNPRLLTSDAIQTLVDNYFVCWEDGVVPLQGRNLHIPLMKLKDDMLQDLRVRISNL
ncbi:hypothetical protein [Phaeobacter italicus]|uniref:hypothetical protein n=1 Tax=Phaeobacter italicus TaxID=481446 RepID=UPI001CD66CF5|nr:hypothetical protein [Phaeobacter italicus]MCA0858183.1 hypothetical protein [Phaeobacter italicus]